MSGVSMDQWWLLHSSVEPYWIVDSPYHINLWAYNALMHDILVTVPVALPPNGDEILRGWPILGFHFIQWTDLLMSIFLFFCRGFHINIEAIKKYFNNYPLNLAYLLTMAHSDFENFFMIHDIKALDKVLVIKEKMFFKKQLRFIILFPPLELQLDSNCTEYQPNFICGIYYWRSTCLLF